MDYSKLEAERLELSIETFDLIELVDQVSSLLYENARKQDTELSVRWAAPVSTILEGDRGKIRQILLNLVGNAIKFTRSGNVQIVCSVKVDDETTETSRKCRCIFDVIDSGIGIDQGKIDSIFDVFTQADASTTREYGGTGLGLSISRELANLMDGELRANRNQVRVQPSH